MTRIFVAMSYSWHQLAELYAQQLRDIGFHVTSTWHAGDCRPEHDLSLEDRHAALRTNIADLQRADVVLVVAYVGEPRATFGEAAFALSLGKPVVFMHDAQTGRQLWDVHPKALRLDINERGDALPQRLHDAVREALAL